MAGYYDAIDASFCWLGDFLLDGGDVKDTSDDTISSLLDQLHDICASSLGDWIVYPQRGATLGDFIGEPNNRDTAAAIHDRLRIAITSAGLVAEEDLVIRVIPVGIYKVLIILKVDVIATPTNSLSDGEPVVTSLIFDYLEQGTYFLDKTPELIHT